MKFRSPRVRVRPSDGGQDLGQVVVLPGSRKVRHLVMASAVHHRARRPIHHVSDRRTTGVGQQIRGAERGSKDQPKGWPGFSDFARKTSELEQLDHHTDRNGCGCNQCLGLRRNQDGHKNIDLNRVTPSPAGPVHAASLSVGMLNPRTTHISPAMHSKARLILERPGSREQLTAPSLHCRSCPLPFRMRTNENLRIQPSSALCCDRRAGR